MKSERLKVRVSPETKEKLAQLAESCNVPVTKYLQGLIHQEIKKKQEATE